MSQRYFRKPCSGSQPIDKLSSAVEHPLPVDAPVKSGRQRLDPGIPLEVLPAKQHPAEQQRRIDRGKLAVEHALPAIDVDEVIKKTMLMRTGFEQERQRLFDPLLAIDGPQVIPLGGDAQRAQPESGGGDTRHPAQRAANRGGPVAHQPSFWAGLFVEEIAPASFQIVKQRLGVLGDLGQGAVDEHARRVSIVGRRLALGLRLLPRLHRRRLGLVLAQQSFA